MNLEIIRGIINNHRQYRADERGIKKIWNRGNGLIDFIGESDNGNMVINALYWRKTDAKVAVAFFDALERQNAKRGIVPATPTIGCVDFGYPYYYAHSFGIHNPPTRLKTVKRILDDIQKARELQKNVA